MSKNIKGINIEIGASTTGLDRALRDVNKQSKDATKELREVNKLIKFNPKETELLAQKQELLGKQVEATSEKLDKLKNAEAQVQEQFKKGEITEEQYRAYQREIVETESKLGHYKKQLKEVTRENDTFARSMESLSKGLKNIGSKVGDAGKQMSKKLTAPIVGLAGASMAAFKEVDIALDDIATNTGTTGKELEAFHNNFKNVAKRTPFEIEAIGSAVGELNTQFEFTGEKLELASEKMLKFSKINGSDVSISTKNAKRAIEAYGLSAEDLDMVLDSVTATGQNTGASADKLFDSVVNGAPQLKALGLDFAEAAMIMGQFEQKGLDGNRALGYLTRAQTQLAKEGKTLEEGLADITKRIMESSDETEQLTIASEYFGTKGASVMLEAIQRGALDFEDITGAAEKAKGSVSSTFEETQDPADKFKTVMNNLKIVGGELGTTMQEVAAPAIEKLTEKVQAITNWFQNLSPETQENIVKIGGLIAVIGPALMIIGKLIGIVGTTIGTLGKLAGIAKTAGVAIGALSGPVGIAIGAIAGIIGVGVALYKNWDTIKEKAGQLGSWVSDKWNGMKESATESFGRIKDTVSGAMDSVREHTKGRLEEIKQSFDESGGGIKGAASGLWTAVKGNYRDGFNVLNKMSGERLGKMVGSFKDKFGSARDTVKGAIDKMKGFFDFDWSLPKLKLPKVSISGKFSLSPLSVPKFGIKWNKEGAIFTKPTIFDTWQGLQGVGEAGAEAILPISKLSSILADMLEEMGIASTGRSSGTINHTGTIRVEGVSNQGELFGAVDIIMDELRREVRT